MLGRRSSAQVTAAGKKRSIFTVERAEKIETILTFEVPPGYREGERLDVYLTRSIQNATRAKVQRGIREGRVTVNGRVATKASYTVQAGDVVVCRVLRPPPLVIVPEPIPLDVVYEDDDLLVVNKPAGMVVHPAYGHRTGTLVHALLHHVGGRALAVEDLEDEEETDDEAVGLSLVGAAPAGPGDPALRPGIVHRLDKDTSGLMVVAKHDAAHVHLARQFERRTIRRRYLALVWGHPDPPEGRIETHLGRDPRDRKRMAVVRPGHGKTAITNYRTLEHMAHTALVEFRLETGRTHQIRVHARHLGHPILGDPVYGGRQIRHGPDTGRRRAFFANLFTRMPRQALHAGTLGFTHPRTGAALDFTAPLPGDMQHVLDRLRQVEGES
ncbi:RluA family pseudouridine synthase [Rhodocaloribacter litoris]|nr:RluA family pseudouridine synthase [Rhodocaloribacter litoris]